MDSLARIRPPQFSEDDAWLPPWLQQCNVEKLNVESMVNDKPTFVQRVEEWQFLHMTIGSRESSEAKGGCNFGKLFFSGTDSSSFSFAQSPENMFQIQLRLSSDGNSENTILTNNTRQTETDTPVRTLEGSPDLGRTANLSLFNNSGVVGLSPMVDIEVPVPENELSRNEDDIELSDAASDAVELCIAASEALVIDEVMKNDSFSKSFSASALLEASLQVKQARLEGWGSTFIGSIHDTNEIDDVSDLDDITMKSAYEDAGIHVTELPEIELSVSRVKDTLESEHDEDITHEKKDISATDCGKSSHDNPAYELKVVDNNIQLEKDLCARYSNGDTHMDLTDSPTFALGTYELGYQNNCMRSSVVQADFFHISDENSDMQKCKMPGVNNNSHGTKINPSAITSYPHAEVDKNVTDLVQERFQSRWFGGWTAPNEVNCMNIARHSIQRPFAAETSFLSESADVAPDENSFVQNCGRENLGASQLSKPSENFFNPEKYGICLSQDDVQSSSASLVDPLCSVVPCSIENTGFPPDANYDDRVLPVPFIVTSEHGNDCLLGTSSSIDELAQNERINSPISNIKGSEIEVCRKFMPLSYYSKQLPCHANIFEKHSHGGRSFFKGVNAELTSEEASFTMFEEPVKGSVHFSVYSKENISTVPHVINRRRHQHFQASSSAIQDLANENLSRTATAIPDSNVKCPSHENPDVALLNCKSQSTQERPSSKHVSFSEKETVIPVENEVQKKHTPSKVRSARASKKSTPPLSILKFSAQPLDRFIKPHLGKERKRLIFQNMEFMLAGLSRQKEMEIEGLIRKYGGVVVSQIPLKILKANRNCRLKSRVLPIVLCLKKIQAPKFLYGCAVNALVLKVNWLCDSITAGFLLPPERYMILPRNIHRKHAQVFMAVSYDDHSLVFNNVGIMLHGKNNFFTHIATIIKHGGGQVFKTLQRLIQSLEAGNISVGVIVADDKSCVSRHLKQCALERNIPLTSIHWIMKCLYSGRVVPLEEKNTSCHRPSVRLRGVQEPVELSQEI